MTRSCRRTYRKRRKEELRNVIKRITVKSERCRIKGYPYQLIKWLPTLEALDEFIYLFMQHDAQDQAVIVKSPRGWTIFTTGKLREEEIESRKDYTKREEATLQKAMVS